MSRGLALLSACSLALAANVAQAQEIERHEPHPTVPIARSVTVPASMELLYLSGAVAPISNSAVPADSVEAYGNTEEQTLAVLRRIEGTLANRGYKIGDIFKLTVFLVGVPEKGGRMDFEGFSRGYARYFGTAEQPNIVARSTVQVAGLVSPGQLVEIEAVAAKSGR